MAVCKFRHELVRCSCRSAPDLSKESIHTLCIARKHARKKAFSRHSCCDELVEARVDLVQHVDHPERAELRRERREARDVREEHDDERAVVPDPWLQRASAR